MSAGDNIDYKHRPGLAGIVARKFASGDHATGESTPGDVQRPRFCTKVSDTAPQNNTAADFPAQLFDMCVHFNAAGTYQGIYMATAGDLSSTCTWTQIA